ncbi:alpha-L-fucosidase [Puia sp. P3]|uniref:alpha-L-fucosidase n=1 Tax=Puia sp. P3 TaxID=3423952 RepID=UPI003D66F93C
MEDPKLVNPVDFDAKQIVGAAKAGGFRGVVIVAKHHDGLCIWPTKTTEHNITKSPGRVAMEIW